jgi:hypothetical protein
MSIDVNELYSLSVGEKLLIVEMLWDDLGESTAEIPLPEWVTHEVARRRKEMQNPSFGVSNEETWRRIANRNG